MLTGKALGAAIEEARIKKAVTKKAMSLHFKVTPPAIQDWVNRGTIDKGRLPDLWEYFKDVVGPAHWGLKSFSPGQLGSSDTPTAIQAHEPPDGTGLSARAFSLASRLDALPSEHRQFAYALMANVLDQFEAQASKTSAPRRATKSSPRAARTP